VSVRANRLEMLLKPMTSASPCDRATSIAKTATSTSRRSLVADIRATGARIRLIGDGDTLLGSIVSQLTGASFWSKGNNAIVITFDEGADSDTGGCCDADPGSGKVATVVITSKGPRGVSDNTPYNHFSLLQTLQRVFGLGCLQFTCDTKHVTPMTPLFEVA